MFKQKAKFVLFCATVSFFALIQVTAVKAGGQIGIGTTTPEAKLDVAGDAHIQGPVGIGTTDPEAMLDVDGGIKVGDDTDDCLANKEGTMRYHNGTMQYCSPTGWKAIGGNGGGGPTVGIITDVGANKPVNVNLGFRPVMVEVWTGGDSYHTYFVRTEDMEDGFSHRDGAPRVYNDERQFYFNDNGFSFRSLPKIGGGRVDPTDTYFYAAF